MRVLKRRLHWTKRAQHLTFSAISLLNSNSCIKEIPFVLLSALYMSETNYFLKTIEHLRSYEEIILYGNILEITNEQKDQTLKYLEREYQYEQANYPKIKIQNFNPEAALWAAKTIYVSAQLMLYRKNEEQDIAILLPSFTYPMSPSAHLSADLVLRFLPDIIKQLKLIDPEDALIGILERHLMQWHYSGVQYALQVELLGFESIIADECLRQLYVDRVIEYKRVSLAIHPSLAREIKAALGMYTNTFWNDLLKQEIFADANS
jgi:hypothetical protein